MRSRVVARLVRYADQPGKIAVVAPNGRISEVFYESPATDSEEVRFNLEWSLMQFGLWLLDSDEIVPWPGNSIKAAREAVFGKPKSQREVDDPARHEAACRRHGMREVTVAIREKPQFARVAAIMRRRGLSKRQVCEEIYNALVVTPEDQWGAIFQALEDGSAWPTENGE